MPLSCFLTRKFNITDSLIGLTGGNSFPGMDLPTECHAAHFLVQKPSCSNYLACQKVSLDVILKATPSASVLQFAA